MGPDIDDLAGIHDVVVDAYGRLDVLAIGIDAVRVKLKRVAGGASVPWIGGSVRRLSFEFHEKVDQRL